MATAQDIDTDLALELSGEHATLDGFRKATNAWSDLVPEVTKSVCGNKNKVQWGVQVKQGSNLVGLSPTGTHSGKAGAVVDALEAGLAILEKDSGEPKHFSQKAIRSVRALSLIGASGREGPVRAWSRERPYTMTGAIMDSATALIEGAYTDHGSIEGTLQKVSARDGYSVSVYEVLHDRPIECVIFEEMLPQALGAFEQRVELCGMIAYRRDGSPVKIKVEAIEVMPIPEELPTADDALGLLRDYA